MSTSVTPRKSGSEVWPVLAIIFAAGPVIFWIAFAIARALQGDSYNSFVSLVNYLQGIFFMLALLGGVIALIFAIVGLARRSPRVLAVIALLLALAAIVLTFVFGGLG
ncbi:MAG: hypothetical protein ABJB03_02625 [Rhodoglobus sp.]